MLGAQRLDLRSMPEAPAALELPGVREISREELARRLRDPALAVMDVLAPETYAAKHIPGASNLPLAEVGTRARELFPDRHAEIAVYCAGFTCPASEQAVRLLHDLGYTNLRHYSGGIADWEESGGVIESVSAPAVPPRQTESRLAPVRTTSTARRIRPPRAPGRYGWGNAILDLIERRTTSWLFMAWLAMIMACGAAYWLIAKAPWAGLAERGAPIGAGVRGLLTAIYFSFVTATSVGYGDVVPVGGARVLAVAEAVSGLLIFGAVVAKFVSRRQDELVREIHRVTFEERLDRVQTNLHLLLAELQAILGMCESGAVACERIAARFESASLVLAGELRTVHDLLYRPRREPDEPVLTAILTSLASALDGLRELIHCLPADFARSPALDGTLKTVVRLAEQICGECVPRVYAPALTVWMDRVRQVAREIT